LFSEPSQGCEDFRFIAFFIEGAKDERQSHYFFRIDHQVHRRAYSHVFHHGASGARIPELRNALAEPVIREYMRQTNEPIVALGPALQFIRGILFALAFYPLREVLFTRKNGWLVTWLVLVMLGILSTFGAAPGSIEGLLYTNFPIGLQLAGWLEIIPQAFLLSVILYYWVNHPQVKWLGWVLGILYALVIIFSILGFVMA
jgi:hypothetical protein